MLPLLNYLVVENKDLKQRERGKTHIDSETHMDLKDLWPALLQY